MKKMLQQQIVITLFAFVRILQFNPVLGSTIYIDPTNTNDSSEDGSIDHPYDSWQDVRFKTGGTYLQKRGTIDSCKAIDIKVDDVILGAYGDGTKPRMFFNLKSGEHALRAYWRKNIVIENLEIISSAEGVSCIYFNANCSNNLVDGCILHGAAWGIRITSGGNKSHTILNTEIYDIKDDGIFIQDASGVEIGYCYVHHVNTKWKPPSTPQSEAGGDAIQLSRSSNWYVHHNVLDRTDSGNKFCFISNDDLQDGCILEHNVFRGPLATKEGGACVYFNAGSNLIIRYNSFQDTGMTGLYYHATTLSIYGNIFSNVHSAIYSGTSTTCELYNNVFHKVTEPAKGTSIIARNNIFDVDDSVTKPLNINRLQASHNHYTVGSGGDFSTSGDPMFVDPANGDFHLQSGSPCVDAGTDVGITVDKDGNSIPHNDIPDIGAFEFGSTNAVDLSADNLSDHFVLAQNYPNPFNPTTTIHYSLACDACVQFSIFNSLGQKIRTLVNSNQPAGQHAVQWKGQNDVGEKVSSGLYFYQLLTDDFSVTRKMILMP